MIDRVGDQHHEQTTVRRHQFAAEVHRQRASQRTAHDTGGNDSKRVFGSERNGTFGNEAQPQHERGLAGLSLALSELATSQKGRDAHTDWRHHTGGHRCGHRCVAL
ncbi:hypothetical protein ALP71_00696 [Pseudomonas coronafaciens pv. garcae]|nr:hypothetical protein ALP71_00696 [Pseudomonas coronafaciens pv. garcae]